jgi:hypothetical protein
MNDRDEEVERAARRGAWPVRRTTLGQDPADPADAATPTDCMAMMWPLAVEAWTLAGLPIPDYARTAAPTRLLRASGRLQDLADVERLEDRGQR